MNISGIVGLIGFWGLLIMAMAMGGEPAIFFCPTAACIVVGVTLGAGLMAFGLRDLLNGVLALRMIVIRLPDEALHQTQAQVLRGLIPPAYAAGVLGTAIGLVQILTTVDDPSIIGVAMAVALLTVLYSVMLAEGLLRPGARHIEHRLSARER